MSAKKPILGRQVLAGVAVFGILVAWAAADLHIISEALFSRQGIESAVSAMLGRKFSLLDARFDLIDGVELLNFRIQAPSGREEDDLFRAAAIRLHHDPAALARGAVEATDVELLLPVFNFVPNPNGQWDLIEMVRHLTLKPGAAPGAGAGGRKPIIRVHDGSARFGHPGLFAENKTVLVDHFNLTLHPFGETCYMVDGGARNDLLGAWSVEGKMDIQSGRAQYVFRGRGLKADANLSGILAKNVVEVWSHYQPAGLLNVSISVDIDSSRPAPVEFTASVEFDGVRAQFWKFPYPVEDLRGLVEFRKAGASIVGLDGHRGDAGFHIRGKTEGYGSEAAVELWIDITRLPLDDTLRDAIPTSSRKGWDLFQPSAGTFTGNIHVVRDFGHAQPTRTYMTLSCEDARFTFREVPAPVNHVNGEIKIDDHTITLSHLTGHRGGTEDLLEIYGEVKDLATPTPSYDVTVDAAHITLNDELRKAVPPAISKVWDLYQPEGAIGLRVVAHKDPDPETKPTLDMTITCLGNSAIAGNLQYPVTDLTGDIHYHAPSVDLNHLEGKHGGATLDVRGNVRLNPEGNDFDLDVGGVAVAFDDALLRTLPDDFRALLLEQRPSGALDFTATVHRRNRPDAAPSTVCNAQLRLIDVGLDPGVSLADLQGTVVAQCQLGAKPQFIGQITLDRVKIENKTLTDVSTTFQQAEKRLVLEDIKAAAYGGHMEGQFQIATDTRAFLAEGKISGIDLRQFARDTFVSGKEVTGELDTEFRIEGQGKDTDALRGKGKLQIRNAHLWDLPVLLEVVNLLKLTRRSPFSSVEIPFTIENRKFYTAPDLVFESDTAKLAGRGSLDFDGRLDLTLDAELLSSLLPSIPVITPLLATLEKTIYAISVGGTFKEPKVSPKPLPFLDGFGRRSRESSEPYGPEAPPPPTSTSPEDRRAPR